MKNFILFGVCFCFIFLIACGGASGPGELTLKYPGNDSRNMAVKSGGYYTSTKTFTYNGNSSKSSSYFICVADYEIDMSQGAISIGAPVKEADNAKVCFSLDGEENGDDKTPLKEGTFAPAKSMKSGPSYNSLSNASIRVLEDGKEKKHFFNIAKTTGDLKITSVSGDTVYGEANLSDGEREIKGTFSAKPFKRD